MTSPHETNGQNPRAQRPTSAGRVSVPSAREELERESRAYSTNQGNGSWQNESPVEASGRARAAQQLEDHDFMAPLRGNNASRPSAAGNYRGMDGASRTGAFRAQEPSIKPGAQDVHHRANAREMEERGATPIVHNTAQVQRRYRTDDAQQSRPSVRKKQEAKRPTVRKKESSADKSQRLRPVDAESYRDRAANRFRTEDIPAVTDAEAYSRYGSEQSQRAARSTARYSRNAEAATERYRSMEEAQERRIPAAGEGQTAAGGSVPPSKRGEFVPMGIPGHAPKDHFPNPAARMKKIAIGAVAVVVVAVVGVFGFQNWDANRPVHIMLNDQEISVEGNQRSVEGMLDAGTVTVTPGNYVAVNGDTMREGEGKRAKASINGQETDDLSTHLNEGDQVKVENGDDIMEPYTDTNEKSINYKTVIEGSGPMHIYTQKGEKGTKVTRTGQESGVTTDVVTKEAKNTIMTKYHVDTKGDKVIALTFDDGPWPTTTDEILDTLEKNNAKATFFTIGNQIANHTDSIKRMMDDGHQICTHTYDHAAGSGRGVNITYMSNSEQKQEIEKGYAAIKDVTGSDASTVVRLPGGNLNEKTAANIQNLITCEVGWSLDTQDWSRPGADSIYNVIMQAEGGSIILMHDGGGDRSQTAEALKRALPKLVDQGYSFITLDEMLEKYPYEGSTDSADSSSSTSSSTDSAADSSTADSSSTDSQSGGSDTTSSDSSDSSSSDSSNTDGSNDNQSN